MVEQWRIDWNWSLVSEDEKVALGSLDKKATDYNQGCSLRAPRWDLYRGLNLLSAPPRPWWDWNKLSSHPLPLGLFGLWFFWNEILLSWNFLLTPGGPWTCGNLFFLLKAGIQMCSTTPGLLLCVSETHGKLSFGFFLVVGEELEKGLSLRLPSWAAGGLADLASQQGDLQDRACLFCF